MGNEINEGGRHNLLSLTFIVNGKEVTVENVDATQSLRLAVTSALELAGMSGRALSEWRVMFNDNELDLSRKVEEYKLTKGVKLFLVLKSGVGGNG